MKAKWLACLVMLTAALCVTRVNAAVNKTTWPDAAAMQFVFVENNSDDNFFVTPGGALDPRMTGANRWTGLKYNGSAPFISRASAISTMAITPACTLTGSSICGWITRRLPIL
ncbi:CFA/I fimbrial minor adhesin [Klebsiella grimontii]|nr:CFA/I fimbrial minor adhesin [Klebsiella grimontii]